MLRLDNRTLASDQEMRTFGDAVKGKMTLTLEGGGQKQQKTIDWGRDVRGPYAAEQSLSRAPIKPGETRDLKMYLPDLNKVCDITLAAKGMEDIMLGDGQKRALLRVEQMTALDGKPRKEFDTSMWVDATGQVLKSAQDILGGMVVYRTTKEGATAPDDAVKVDRIDKSVVKVAKSIPNPTGTRDIRYRVTLKDDDPTQILPNDRRQSLRKGPGAREAMMEIRTAGLSDGAPGPAEPGEEFLRPNALITSEDARVKALSREAVGGTADAWEKATKINHFVFQKIRDKNFATTFAPASEVARNLSGDCSEHSVLSAAMCRAAGVPARVVVGLIYDERHGGFGYHMWNEVYVNRRWVALDAAWDQTAVDATHIKLSETSLDGIAPYEAFLPIVRVMGKMSLETLDVR